jgi:cephalosporin hydroxylase
MNRQEFDVLWNTPAGNNWEGRAHETYGWWAQQHPDELWWVLEKLQAIEAKNVLEIGSAHGGTLFFWDQATGPEGTVVSLDGWFHHGITLDFSKAKSKLHMIKGDSHEQQSLQLVQERFQRPIDFLFIDGDHTYGGVKMDYEMYSPLVRPGGLVVFHDTHYDTDIQVRRFFREIDEPKEEIDLRHGMGVIYK